MKKNKITYVVMAVFLLNIFIPATGFANVTDVPKDHWAYQAVTNAVAKGYLTTFEDGTFQGTRAVDRFALASVVNRLIEDIEVARVKGTSGDLNEIRELRIEFENDLAVWYANQEGLEEELARIRQIENVAEERVSRVVGAQVQLEEQVDSLLGEIVSLQDHLAQVQGQIGYNAENVSESELRLDELIYAVAVLEKEVLKQQEDIKSLENWAGEKGAAFVSLQSKDDKVSQQLDSLNEHNAQLERDLQNIAVRLQREIQEREELSLELEEARIALASTRSDLLDGKGFDELKKQLSSDVNAQINASLIREQRLERQIKTLEEEFESYRVTAEKDVKSAKTFATLAIALAAVGAVVGLVGQF